MATPHKEQKIAALSLASEHFRHAHDEFSSRAVEVNVKLLRTQMKLEQKMSSTELFGLCLNDTLTKLLKVCGIQIRLFADAQNVFRRTFIKMGAIVIVFCVLHGTYQQENEVKVAEDMRREAGVSDRRWMWLRAKVFAA